MGLWISGLMQPTSLLNTLICDTGFLGDAWFHRENWVLGGVTGTVSQSARTTMASARICATMAARVRSGEIGEGSGVIEEQGEFPWRIVREVPPSAAPETVHPYVIEVLPPDGNALNGCIVRVWRHEPNSVEGATP